MIPDILTTRARRNFRHKLYAPERVNVLPPNRPGAELEALGCVIKSNGYGDRIAIYSRCRQYRYALLIDWDRTKPLRVVIGLNPSTATEDKNDPTVLQCVNRAKREGCGGLLTLNLFPFRATDPREMKAAADPEGGQTPAILVELMQQALAFRTGYPQGEGYSILAAWGNHGKHRSMSERVCDHFSRVGLPLYMLGITQQGEPSHPLYKPAELHLTRYRRGHGYLDTVRRSAAA